MYYLYSITLLYMRTALLNQSVTCRVQIRRSRRAFAWCSVIVNQRREKLITALAMAGLATQVHAVFAVAVALGGPRTPPGPANPFHRPRAPERPCAVSAQPSALILSWILAGGELYKLKTALNWPLAAFGGLHDAFGSIISELGAA
jgi:hypothetical protein